MIAIVQSLLIDDRRRHHGNAEKNSAKFCCERAEPRLLGLSFLTIVLGGTAALHAYRAWGAVIFLQTKVCLLVFALTPSHAHVRLPLKRKPSTLRPNPNVEFSKTAAGFVANCVRCRSSNCCNHDGYHLLASRELAGTHSAAKHR